MRLRGPLGAARRVVSSRARARLRRFGRPRRSASAHHRDRGCRSPGSRPPGEDLGQGAGDVGLVGHVRLVGLDFDQLLADRDLVADLLQPGEDRPLLHRVGEAGHDDLAHRGEVEGAEDRGGDPVFGRHRRQLELLGVGQRHLGHAEALDRGVEVVEAGELDAGGELGGDAVGRPALLDAEGAVGLGDRGGDGLDVERAQAAEVDDLDRDALLGLQLLGDFERAHGGEGVGDEGQVGALAGDGREADRGHQVRVDVDLALLFVDRQVLDHQHRVVVADRRLRAGPWRRPGWPARRP